MNISTFLGSAVCSLLLWVDGDKEEIIMLSHGSVLSAGVESSALTPVIINQEISTLSNTTDLINILQVIKDHEVT